MRDLVVDNLSSNTASGIGIDFTRVSNGGVENVQIKRVETGIQLLGLAYYNLFLNIVISDAKTGMKFVYNGTNGTRGGSAPNSNRVVGAQLVDVDVGFDIDGDNNNFLGCSVEQGSVRAFTRGFRITLSTSTTNTVNNNSLFSPRLKNSSPPGTDIGIQIGSGASGTSIFGVQYANVTTPLQDLSSSQSTLQAYCDGTYAKFYSNSVILYGSTAGSAWAARNAGDSAYVTFNTGTLNVRSGDAEVFSSSNGYVLSESNGSHRRRRIQVDSNGTITAPLI